MSDTLIQFARAVLPPEAYDAFSYQALHWAGQSQEARFAALTVAWSVSLLAFVLWIGLMAWAIRHVWPRIRGYVSR